MEGKLETPGLVVELTPAEFLAALLYRGAEEGESPASIGRRHNISPQSMSSHSRWLKDYRVIHYRYGYSLHWSHGSTDLVCIRSGGRKCPQVWARIHRLLGEEAINGEGPFSLTELARKLTPARPGKK